MNSDPVRFPRNNMRPSDALLAALAKEGAGPGVEVTIISDTTKQRAALKRALEEGICRNGPGKCTANENVEVTGALENLTSDVPGYEKMSAIPARSGKSCAIVAEVDNRDGRFISGMQTSLLRELQQGLSDPSSTTYADIIKFTMRHEGAHCRKSPYSRGPFKECFAEAFAALLVLREAYRSNDQRAITEVRNALRKSADSRELERDFLFHHARNANPRLTIKQFMDVTVDPDRPRHYLSGPAVRSALQEAVGRIAEASDDELEKLAISYVKSVQKALAAKK